MDSLGWGFVRRRHTSNVVLARLEAASHRVKMNCVPTTCWFAAKS